MFAVGGFYGWKLLAALWLILFINLAFPVYGASVINAAMLQDLGIDRRTLGLMTSVYMLMSGLPGPVVAMYVNRFGVRTALITGSAILFGGAIALATIVDNGALAVLFYGIVVGLGVITGGPLAAQAGTAFWFLRRRALAISILLSAGGIGGFVAAGTLTRLIAAYDGNWRAGWWLIAALALVSAAVAALFVREKPEDLGQQPDGGNAAGGDTDTGRAPGFVTRDHWTFSDALRSPALWLLLFCSLGMSGGFTQAMGHAIPHMQDMGYSSRIAGDTWALVVASTLLGKVMLAALGDRIDPRYLWAFSVAVFGVGMLVVLDAGSTAELYVFAVCVGLGFGGGVPCMMTVLGNYFGSAAYASVMGITFAVQTTAGALGSFVAGDVYERVGSYTIAFTGTSVLCFAGALLLVVLRPPKLHKAGTRQDVTMQAGTY